MSERQTPPRTTPIDPVCAIHGKKWSEHPGGRCLYCCLCFKPLTPEECHALPDGTREDVCEPCAEMEALGTEREEYWSAIDRLGEEVGWDQKSKDAP